MIQHQQSRGSVLLDAEGVKLGLASPERTIDHRQAVKRSGTPAMYRKVTECQRYDRLSD